MLVRVGCLRVCLSVIFVALAACGNGTASSTGNSATVADSSVTPSTASSAAPLIGGQPATTVQAGSLYSFTPTASDPNGRAMTFQIDNKPSWLSFDLSTGSLSGTPTSSAVGTYPGIVIHVSDGQAAAALASLTIVVLAEVQSTTISGQPSTSVAAGSPYSFTPAASSRNGGALRFSIANAPSWASFDPGSGTLSGSPTVANTGTNSGIVISVSDGASSAALPAFAITVSELGTGSATLTWSPPVQNVDGSALTNLAGYKVYYGKSATSLTSSDTISNPGIATYVVGNLTPGTWFFAVKSFTSASAESDFSGTVSQIIL